jgi:hypothetical protein
MLRGLPRSNELGRWSVHQRRPLRPAPPMRALPAGLPRLLLALLLQIPPAIL